MTHDWPIQSRADRCAHTGREFIDGDFFFTLLFRSKQGALHRRDVCETAWKELSADAGAEAPFSFWRSKFVLPPPAAAETLPKENAETLLRRFLAGGQAEHARTCYILALMLERKRILRPVNAQEDDGRRLLFYEHSRTGEAFVIVDPSLRLDQLGEVREEVATLLQAA